MRPAYPHPRTPASWKRALLPASLPELPGHAGALQFALKTQRGFGFLELLVNEVAFLEPTSSHREFLFPVPRQVSRLWPVLRIARQEKSVTVEVGELLAGDALLNELLPVDDHPVVIGD
jgi:hypothetical protein